MDTPDEPPIFDQSFQQQLEQLLEWRRDVRRFRTDPVPPDLIRHCLAMAQLAPSVGNSCPWRWVSVQSPDARLKVRSNFEKCNAEALSAQNSKRSALYAKLKLAGLYEAPEQFAVFCDEGTIHGHGLGRRTMPAMLEYSVVLSVMNFWLAARAASIGVGWVSILDPEEIRVSLDMPETYNLVAYLCGGWPLEEHIDPELLRFGWQNQNEESKFVYIR